MTKAATAKTAPIEGPVVPTTMLAIKDLHLASEAPKGANLVVRDSSRGSPMTDAELKASIYTKGLIHPLYFKMVSGKAYVVAGNRRLRMLREIFADALDSSVQTKNVDDMDGDWREIAIDSNLQLPAHIVERYEVIVALKEDLKLSPEDARLRFGMTESQFNQVMRLGKLSPKIRKLWKDGEIDAKTAQTFTLEPDHKEQDRIYDLCKKQAWNNNPVADFEVKRKIIPENQRDAGKLVSFVGVEACRAAKVLKQDDLFGSNHIVSDMKALNKLAGDKLAAVRDSLLKAGWSWAIPEQDAEGSTHYYGDQTPDKKLATPTKEEKAQLAEFEKTLSPDNEDEDLDFEDIELQKEGLEQEIRSRGYTEAQRKKGGCFLKITNAGVLVIEYGKVKPEQKKSVAASERASAKPSPKKPGAPIKLTHALANRLSEQLQEGLKPVISRNHHVAVAALIAGLASAGHVVDVKAGEHSYDSKAKQHFLSTFEGALKAKPEAQLAILAQVAGAALSIITHSSDSPAPMADPCLLAVVAALKAAEVNKAIAEVFDAADYFAGVPGDVSVAAVRASMGDEHAGKVAKMKKADAAKFAAANVPAKGWLPKELRSPHYTGPTEKTAAKVKAPVKKVAKKKKAK